MKQLIELLEELAKKKTWYDREDYDPQDLSGGNFDDAYSRGCDDGEVALARELLNRFFSKTDTLENRIEATWNEYQFLQDEYHKMTGKEHEWLK